MKVVDVMKCKYCKNQVLQQTKDTFHCSFCELDFSSEELNMKLKKEIKLANDPNFYQYTKTKDLINLPIIELVNYLSLARKEKRRIYDKIYSSKNTSDDIDKENFNTINKMITVIQNLLIEKQGYYPTKIFNTAIQKEYQRILKLQ